MRRVREAVRSDGGLPGGASTVRLVDADGRRLPARIEVGTTDHDGEQHYTLSLTEPPRQAGSRALDRTGDLLRGVFEESNDGLLVIDPTADRVVDCNGRACDLLGWAVLNH